MAKITELPPAGPIGGGELVPVVQGDAMKVAPIAGLVAGGLSLSAQLNLWPDPRFETIRSPADRIEGRLVVFHTEGVWISGKADALARNPFSAGAWKCSAGLLSWRVWFDLAGIDDVGLQAGDKMSFGFVLNAPIGVAAQAFMRFYDADHTALTPQIGTAAFVSDGEPHVVQLNDQEVPPNFAYALVYLDGAAGDQYCSALWVMRGEIAGSQPPSGAAFVDRNPQPSSMLNIWADPRFETVRSLGAMIGGKPAMLHGSGFYVAGDTNTLARSPIARGAWRATAGGLLSWRIWLDLPGVDKLGIEAGDPISFGFLVNANPGVSVMAYVRFYDDANLPVSAQASTAPYVSDGAPRVVQLNGLPRPANAAYALAFLDGDGGDKYLAALWAVPGSDAGQDVPVQTAYSPAAAAASLDADALALPPRLFALAGLEANVYPANLRMGRSQRLFDFTVAGERGLQLEERWTWTPDDGDAGDYGFAAVCCDPDSLDARGSASAILHVVAEGQAAGSAIKLLTIGDSNTNSGERLNRLLELSAARPTDAQIELLGTRTTVIGATAVHHEGRPGWRLSNYYATAEITSGGLTVENPFIAAPGQKFNAAHYLAATSVAAPDVVAWPLGVNDVFGFTSDSTLLDGIATFVAQLSEMIGVTVAADVGSWREVSMDIVHLIPLPLLPLGQDGFAGVTGSGQSQARYRRNIVALAHGLIDAFGGREDEKLFLLPHNASHDVAHNMPKAAVAPWNVHTAVAVQRDGNDVHPYAAGGNEQLADCEFAALNWLAAAGHV